MPAPEILTHEDAKLMIPPGAYIWRAFAHEAWEGRNPPKKRLCLLWELRLASGVFPGPIQIEI